MKPSVAVSTPEEYIAALDEPRRSDLERIHRLIRETVPELVPTIMSGMLGYGPFRYRYASGREGETTKLAVASQKNYFSIYACAADASGYVAERFRERLPKANIGKSCVRFKRLDDLDPEVLKELFRETATTGYEV